MKDITRKLGKPGKFNFGNIAIGKTCNYADDPNTALKAWLTERRSWDERFLIVCKVTRPDKPWLVIRVENLDQVKKWQAMPDIEQTKTINKWLIYGGDITEYF